MGGYSWFANSIPQIESKPPQELSLEGGNVTPAQLVKAGEEIFHTKGTCEICHRIGQKGTRAPDLAGVGARAAKTEAGDERQGVPDRVAAAARRRTSSRAIRRSCPRSTSRRSRSTAPSCGR